MVEKFGLRNLRMGKIPEVKDIETIRSNLKKKQSLLELGSAKKNQLKNDVMLLEAEKNSLMVNLQQQQEILRHKSEIQEELRNKLSNTEDQTLNTDIGSENVLHTIEKYMEIISEMKIRHTVTDSTIDKVPKDNIDGMEAQIENLVSQIQANSIVIDKLWNINSEH